MEEKYLELLEQLFREYYKDLLAFAMRHFDSSELAEEAVQEVFRTACTKPWKLKDCTNEIGWLFCALKLEIKNIQRNREHDKKLIERLEAKSHRSNYISYDRINIDVVYSNLVNDPDFHLIKKLAVDGKSQKELAQELGIKLSACKKRVQRARERLRNL